MSNIMSSNQSKTANYELKSLISLTFLTPWFSIVWFGSADLVYFDSDLLIRYSLFREWLIQYCVCNCYVLTLCWNLWRHSRVQSTNLLTPIEIHWAQWSCSCYTSLLRSPGCSLLECHDAWHVPQALLLGCSKMQGCQPICANGYFTTHKVSVSLQGLPWPPGPVGLIHFGTSIRSVNATHLSSAKRIQPLYKI